MARKSKQSEACKQRKSTGRKRKYNAQNYAFLRITRDMPRQEIIDGIVERYDYAPRTAEAIYNKAAAAYGRQLMRDSEKIHNKNLSTLEGLIEVSIDEGDSSTMLKAMDMQNKMVGSYETKVKIDNEGETPLFKIKIDD